MAKSGDLLQWKCECCLRHPQSLMQYGQKTCPSRSKLPTCGLSDYQHFSTVIIFQMAELRASYWYLRQCVPPDHFFFLVILSCFVSRPLQHVILGNMLRYVTADFHVTRYVKMHFMWRENCALLGYYAACNGNSLLTFQDNIWVPSTSSSNADHSHHSGGRTILPLLLNGLNFLRLEFQILHLEILNLNFV